MLSIPNDIFLFCITGALVYFLIGELMFQPPSIVIRKKRKYLSPKYAPLLLTPIFQGAIVRHNYHMDLLSLCRFIPCNAILSNAENERTENTLKKPPRPSSVNASSPINKASKQGTSEGKGNAPENIEKQLEICKKIQYPFGTGCEPDGINAKALLEKYPELSLPDIVRFLVARKGVLKAAEEMIDKCLGWRKLNFPLKRNNVLKAFQTMCFFPYGVAKDGTPCVYMRGGLYDCHKATPEEYVLAAAYTIDWSLQQHPEQTNVTVIVHTASVPNGPNQSADTNFIKLFIQVLSDNYPERLKRLAIFPFPWYGRAIWGMLKVFVDKRTQDKIMLLSTGSNEIPNELKEFVDLSEMPTFIGGTATRPVPKLLDTLPTSE
jgi:hypothetical protein